MHIAEIWRYSVKSLVGNSSRPRKYRALGCLMIARSLSSEAIML